METGPLLICDEEFFFFFLLWKLQFQERDST